MAILGLFLLSALCLLTGGTSNLLRLVFPMGSLVVGVFLYKQYPLLYVGFTWWLWFITPLLRRLVDWRTGIWDTQGLMLLSPFLVTLVTLATFLQYLPRAYRWGGLPLILCFVGVFYGLLVGLVEDSLAEVARALLDWLPPMLFGFHLFVNWRNYPSYRQNIQRSFLWGVLVMGVYGVVQYVVAPDWDRFWLTNAIAIGGNCFGQPAPFQIRVWSTQQSPLHFGATMTAGLLLLLNSQAILRFPASAFGYLAFMLTLVRTTWGGWFVGLVTYTTSLKPRLQMRLIITMLVIGICIAPLISIDTFSGIINDRVSSISNVEQDASYQARKEMYDTALNDALMEPLGKGIGNGGFGDSGILNALFTLGWLGGIPYLGGIVLIFFNMFQGYKGHLDPFASAARAISISFLSMMVNSNYIVGSPGVIFWGFLGMVMAAQKYYQHQSFIEIKTEGNNCNPETVSYKS